MQSDIQNYLLEMVVDYKDTLDYALDLDKQDELAHYRSLFLIPEHNGNDTRYFCGNSLGLQPASVKQYMEDELADWAKFGVEGHFLAKNPWFSYHHIFSERIAKLVGAKKDEVVIMNGLTVNLHLLLCSFYRPNKERFKIIMEAGAFPSDRYAIETQVRMHHLNPEDCIIELYPAEGKHIIEEEDIVDVINKHGSQLAVVMLGGVNYYTGQLFDMEKIASAAHAVGAFAGFDLAHATGNVPLNLHNWKVDFACWCSYKYLNAGPGAVAGVFVHEKHGNDTSLFRLGGWWGNDEKSRFTMPRQFVPQQGATGWQMSNAPVFNMVGLNASLEIFINAGMDKMQAKSRLLTGYLEFLLRKITHLKFEMITPADPSRRGCQVSMLFEERGREVFDALTNNGIIADWREPNVIRVAPVPLYNTFEDVYRLYEAMNNVKVN